MRRPLYPIYVPTKGRADRPLTARMFEKDDVDFHLVVEPQEVPAYSKWKDHLLVLPENDRGLVFARNWIKEHSIAAGDERHWQFDDDVIFLCRLHEGRKVKINSGVAIRILEDFTNRYENVALSSFNSDFFMAMYTNGRGQSPPTSYPPLYVNARCYTNFLVLNSTPYRWRHRYNEDTDMSLQVLVGGWCTILINAFLMKTPATLKAPGGQMVNMYGGDGRLRMARQLQRVWPGVVDTYRRFGRPQHRVKGYWRFFDTPLKLKPGVVIPEVDDDFGLKLRAVAEVKHPQLREWYESHQQ